MDTEQGIQLLFHSNSKWSIIFKYLNHYSIHLKLIQRCNKINKVKLQLGLKFYLKTLHSKRKKYYHNFSSMSLPVFLFLKGSFWCGPFFVLLQLCPTLCNSMDCSPAGSSIHGILQERILEWVAFPFFRGSSPCRDQTCVSYVSCTDRRVLYHWPHLGSPRTIFRINLFLAALGLCCCTWALWQVGATL